MPTCRTKKGKFTTCRAGMKRVSSKKKKRGTRGYGQGVKVFSGFGKLGVGMDAFLPPLVGGGAALGTSLLLRAFVDPQVKGEGGAPEMEADGSPKVHWAFKYAGLLGAGAGILTSAILGPFQGWGSTVAGAVCASMAGLTAQFYNKVVPEKVDSTMIRSQYAWRGLGKYAPYGMIAAQPRQFGPANGMQGYGQGMQGMQGYGQGGQGYGMIGATPTPRRFVTPGRGTQSMPASVLAQVNPAAFGGGGM